MTGAGCSEQSTYRVKDCFSVSPSECAVPQPFLYPYTFKCLTPITSLGCMTPKSYSAVSQHPQPHCTSELTQPAVICNWLQTSPIKGVFTIRQKKSIKQLPKSSVMLISNINVVKTSLKIACKGLIYNWSFNKHSEISFQKGHQPNRLPTP